MDSDQKERAEYWATVKSIAQEALEAEKNGDDPHDFIHESVDGSHYVIYTYANLVCLQESDHEDAAFEDGRESIAECDSYSKLMALLAFYAMREDVGDAYQELKAESEETSLAE